MSSRSTKIRLIVSLTFMVLAAILIIIYMSLSSDIDEPTPPDEITTGVRLETAEVGPVDPALAGLPDADLLRIRLSQGEALPVSAPSAPLASGEPLSEAEIAQLLARLTPLTEEEEDVTDFRLPEESLPPPRPGETVPESFPPPPTDLTRPDLPDEPLRVLRYAPEGDVPVVPFLSVTFNQPMVPLTTLDQLAEADIPVRITPELPGVWKWLGSQTLVFEYEGPAGDRFPMATEYRVEIPAGIAALSGAELEESVSWQFRTPPVEVEQFYPRDRPQPLEPLIFARFNQAIEPAAVLDAIRLTANDQEQPLRLATPEEIEADSRARQLANESQPDRWIVFRPQQPLPADSRIAVSIGPGVPSAEGPRLTAAAQQYSFRTFSPLRVAEHRCGWGNDCPPFTPFFIVFNNPLDPSVYDESMIRIEPAMPGAVANIYGDTLQIRGMTQGQTSYRVTLDAGLQDIFGQRLGEDVELTFNVGPMPQLLSGPDRPMVTLDPAQPSLAFYSTNYDRLNLRVYSVGPEDLSSFRQYLREAHRDSAPDPPGQLLDEQTITIDSVADRLTETTLDLSPFLENGYGQRVVIIEPPDDGDARQRRQAIRLWVQATQIGLDALVDPNHMVAWATALNDGAPLANVTIRQYPTGASAVTGQDGLARLDLPDLSAAGNNAELPLVELLLAEQGDDMAILPASPYFWRDRHDSGWFRAPQHDMLRWYVFDDRAIYRPGEEVRVKGWLRVIEAGPTRDVALPGESAQTIAYQLMDSRGNLIDEGSAEVSGLAGFDLALTLPDNVNLGYAYLNLRLEGRHAFGNLETTHQFQIQEFRRPEFEVSARMETAGPYLVGDQATASVRANYFAGGPLPNADVTWNVHAYPGHYAPPNWPDFIFGQWSPWWLSFSHDAFMPPWIPQAEYREQFTGVTDAGGYHYLRLDFDSLAEPRPYSVRADATVMDVNRQAWSAQTNLLVHPAALYVGLRSERNFVPQGTPLEIELIVTDLDGNPVAGQPVNVRAALLDWQFQQGSWQEVETDVQECDVVSADEVISCTFATETGGSLRITATVADSQGRQNQSQFTRWIGGGERPLSRRVEQESLTLIPDRENYQPGDVAEILVQAPFSPAEGLLTISRDGILSTESFRVEEESHVLRIPISDEHIPNLNIQVDLVGAAPRLDDDGEAIAGAPPRPAFAVGQLGLPIPPLSRALSVEAELSESALSPGETTTLAVTVRDAAGQPAGNAELAVVVVDEAILALTNYQLADPLDIFYLFRSPMVQSSYGRSSVYLVSPEQLRQDAVEIVEVEATRLAAEIADDTPAPMAAPAMEAEEAMVEREAAPDPIQVRRDFNPLAAFVPAARADANGQAEITIQLPDNLTRYRVMVVAVSEGRYFGTAETNLTARLPLMVRPSAPRFLNFGDQFEFPVVLQNQTGQPLTVDVALEVSNLTLTGPAGRRVTVPANDRVEVRFPATTQAAGTARFQVAAVAGPYADAAAGEFPVYTPATSEAFAAYGVIDQGAIAQPLVPPDNVFSQFGGLEITTSSTALQALTDAVVYLTNYPYRSSEALASRILSVSALRDVLEAFAAAELPPPAELTDAIQQDIDRLQELQNDDGGFAIWQRGDESWPYYSVYAAHALQAAGEKGFVVSGETRQRSLAYLRDIERHYPHWYGTETRQSLSAYALYVRHLMGDSDPAKARGLLQEAGLNALSLEAVAWLWPILDDGPEGNEIERHLQNRAVETAGAANFFTSYGDDAYLMLHSNRRSDAVILEALINLRPESDLIPKVVNGLMAHRVRGHWGNTQENSFVLLALDRYFRAFEAQTPNFVARIWLGDIYAGEHAFAGRTTDYRLTTIPMSYLAEWEEATADLIIDKDGEGRLYYRLGLRYAPEDLNLPPLDMGFAVQRRYEAVDDPDDVYQDEEGVWHIRAGALVRVEVTLVAPNRRYHVALVDRLPAGLEIVNPDLAVTADMPANPDDWVSYGWWWRHWYQYQNLRDERAEAFTTLLWEGVYTYSYTARATTPGAFIAPPAKAEEMYSPEVFGRSGSDWVVVE